MTEIKKRLPPHLAEKLPEDFTFIIHYIDDLFIYSDNPDIHLLHLHAVFEALRYAGLKMSPKKCNFYCESMKILGINMKPTENELSLDKAKANAFLN